MWTDKYIGIPFKRNGNTMAGIDCWRLVTMVYRNELKIELPEYIDVYPSQSDECQKEVCLKINKEKEKWQIMDKPIPFDVVLLRIGNWVIHCGIVVNNSLMLHTSEGINASIESYTGMEWKNRVEGFYRYV